MYGGNRLETSSWVFGKIMAGFEKGPEVKLLERHGFFLSDLKYECLDV